MKKMAGYSDSENRADAMRLADMLRTIYLCPKPTIAKVQGDCYAGGMGLVAACDIAVSADTVNFCLSEVKLGLIPATISPYVIKAMGENAARRYFLTAERFDAHEAHRIGFVHEVMPLDELDGARWRWPRRWRRTARTPCAKRRFWCARSPAGRSTTPCWKTRQAASPPSAPRWKGAKASPPSSRNASPHGWNELDNQDRF
jgi:enoyl-CoA hydratase/carnithine racemase